MKTVLITGCSSGYGLATARHFHALGWKREDCGMSSSRGVRIVATTFQPWAWKWRAVARP